MPLATGFNSDYKDILKEISEVGLLQRYFGITELPCVINAPYRKDNNPSLSLFIATSGTLRFKDFATNESGGIVDLLMKIWRMDFESTIRKISRDNIRGGSTDVETKAIKSRIISKHIVSTSNIDVSVREWRDYDLEFWEMFGISLPWLKFGDVYPITRIFYTSQTGERTSFPADKYAYCYVEYKDGKQTLKIYQPYSKVCKWMSKHNSSVWDLWTKLPPTGDKLIITSSRKDALCLWENTGIPSTSLQGEGYIPKEKIVNQLKSRFKEIYVLYDNDFTAEENHGRIDGERICKMFGLKQIELPETYKCKDPSDFVRMHGRKGLYDIVNKLINDT